MSTEVENGTSAATPEVGDKRKAGEEVGDEEVKKQKTESTDSEPTIDASLPPINGKGKATSSDAADEEAQGEEALTKEDEVDTEVDPKNIINGPRRTRGVKVDYTSQEAQDKIKDIPGLEDDDDDEEVEPEDEEFDEGESPLEDEEDKEGEEEMDEEEEEDEE